MNKKLSISRETLRVLNGTEAKDVQGGQPIWTQGFLCATDNGYSVCATVCRGHACTA